MLAFLKLVPLKTWLYVGVLVALLVSFGMYTSHERTIGAARILAADAAALVKAQRLADIQTAALAQKAEDASHVHDQELTDLRTYRSSHPVHVGVCRAAGNSIPSVSSAASTVNNRIRPNK